MARVGRLAGAIVVETEGTYYLVGNTKRPCDWAAEGFEPPVEIDALKRPFIRLSPLRTITFSPPVLTVALEGEALARALAERLLIERNGSVSDRLWRLIVSPGEDEDAEPPPEVNARWLGEVPMPIWAIVRERVLKCV